MPIYRMKRIWSLHDTAQYNIFLLSVTAYDDIAETVKNLNIFLLDAAIFNFSN